MCRCRVGTPPLERSGMNFVPRHTNHPCATISNIGTIYDAGSFPPPARNERGEGERERGSCFVPAGSPGCRFFPLGLLCGILSIFSLLPTLTGFAGEPTQPEATSPTVII